jgi:hypothetical protein
MTMKRRSRPATHRVGNTVRGLIVLALLLGGYGAFNLIRDPHCGGAPMTPEYVCVTADGSSGQGMSFTDMLESQRTAGTVAVWAAGASLLAAAVVGLTAGNRGAWTRRRSEGGLAVTVALSGDAPRAVSVRYGIGGGTVKKRAKVTLPFEAEFTAAPGDRIIIGGVDPSEGRLIAQIEVNGRQVSRKEDEFMVELRHRLR